MCLLIQEWIYTTFFFQNFYKANFNKKVKTVFLDNMLIHVAFSAVKHAKTSVQNFTIG